MNPSPVSPLHFPRILALGAALLAGPLAAAPPVSVTGFDRTAADRVELAFRDDGTGQLEDFEIQGSTSLTSADWAPIPSSMAEITPVSQGRWVARIQTDASVPSRFFRVLKAGVVLSASFASPTTTLIEGAGGTGVLVNFNGSFTGTLFYTVDYGDGPASGSIELTDATSAFVPITPDDDDDPNSANTLLLRLDLGDASYSLGVNSTTTLILTDNDSSWAGTLTLPDRGGEVAVRLLVINQNGTQTVCFKTDGGGLIPPAPSGSGWFFNSFNLDLDGATFSAGAGGVELPAGSTFYGIDTTLSLLFAASGSDQVTADEIEGTFSLSTTVPDHDHLNVDNLQGTFALYRQPALAAPSSAPTAN